MNPISLDLTNADAWLTAGRVAGFTVAGYLTALWVALILWTYRDIRGRSTDPWVQALCVLTVGIFFLPGLLLYLALRPQEELVETYNRRLESEAFMQELEKRPSCPGCRRAVQDSFVVCPYCRTTLRTPCAQCGEYLAESWVACAFCGSDRRQRGELEQPRPVAATRATPMEPARRPEQRPRAPQPQTTS